MQLTDTSRPSPVFAGLATIEKVAREKVARPLWLAVLAAFSMAACGASSQTPVSAYELQVSDRVTLAGLLDAQALPQLRDEGVVVVDLRTAEEGVAEEATQMKQAGITYYNLPVGRDGLSADVREKFSALLEEHSGRPVLVHCRSGNRAGLLWATHLIDEGKTAEEALSVVDGIVTSHGIRGAIKNY
ncbi:MAG: beta-lactamase hydrolase domain-containing protein [Pseudomonadales bacterium]